MSPREDWSHIEDNNERRKAQNRVAQRNYRSRQRRRLELAETILLDMSQVAAGVDPKWAGQCNMIDPALINGNSVTSNGVPAKAYSDFSNSHGGNLAMPYLNSCTPDLGSQPDKPFSLEGVMSPMDSFGIEDSPGAGQTGIRKDRDNMNREFGSGRASSSSGCIGGSSNNLQAARTGTTTPSIESPGVAQGSITKIDLPSQPEIEGDDCTPLMIAAARGNAQMVRILVQSGADTEAKNKDGKTALFIAVEREHTAIARTLIEMGADIRTSDASGLSLFHKAIMQDDVGMLRTLLEWCKEASEKSSNKNLLKNCVNLRDNKRRTLVFLSALIGRVEMVELLVEYGADVNATSKSN